MNREPWGQVARVAVGAMLFAAAMFGQQSSGSLGEQLRTRRAEVVPGAKVTLTDVAQGDNREIVTGADGMFFFNPLKPSTYKRDG